MGRLLTLLYSCVHILALPWMLYRWLAAGDRNLRARFGAGLEPVPGKSIWLHASSVGEVSLLEPLVNRLVQAYPQIPLVISAYTATGLDTAKRLFPAHRTLAFPVDLPFVVERFLRQLKPRLVVVAESEIWPNFFCAAAGCGVSLAIVNGKMSERSCRMHAHTHVVARALRGVNLVAVQAEEHAERMRRLGVDPGRVFVTGNMKYDLVSAAAHDDLRRVARQRLGIGDEEIVLVGGSLHEREDEALLDAVLALGDAGRRVRVIIVPRYPQDARGVRDNAAKRGLDAVLKTEAEAAGEHLAARVLVVDTLGELRSLYAAADIAFVGGSLFYRGSNKGGHNLMEPAVCEVPVIFGPYNFSFRETVASLLAADAGIEVQDAQSLSRALARLIGDPGCRERMGARARAVVLDHQGATERNFALLRGLLAGQGH